MTQTFSKTENQWSQIQPFLHGGVEVRVTTYAGDDHSAATTVFTSRNDSEVFHADKHCHRLHRGDTVSLDGEETCFINAHPLERVMGSYLSPIRPCDYCTQDIHKTADIVKEYDNVPESCLSYFEPGDQVVSTTVSTDPETGERTVRESSREAYPDGGSL